MDEPRYLVARQAGPDRSGLAIGLVALAVLVAGILAGGAIVGARSTADASPTPPSATPIPAATWPFRVDAAGRVVVAFDPTATRTPSPTRTARPTTTPIPLCPGEPGRLCWWPTPTRPPVYPTAVPTCSATPMPGKGCVWTMD